MNIYCVGSYDNIREQVKTYKKINCFDEDFFVQLDDCRYRQHLDGLLIFINNIDITRQYRLLKFSEEFKPNLVLFSSDFIKLIPALTTRFHFRLLNVDINKILNIKINNMDRFDNLPYFLYGKLFMSGNLTKADEYMCKLIAISQKGKFNNV